MRIGAVVCCHTVSKILLCNLTAKTLNFQFTITLGAECGSMPQLVLLTGLEPVWYRYRGILSPLRLPISPQQHLMTILLYHNSGNLSRAVGKFYTRFYRKKIPVNSQSKFHSGNWGGTYIGKKKVVELS